MPRIARAGTSSAFGWHGLWVAHLLMGRMLGEGQLLLHSPSAPTSPPPSPLPPVWASQPLLPSSSQPTLPGTRGSSPQFLASRPRAGLLILLFPDVFLTVYALPAAFPTLPFSPAPPLQLPPAPPSSCPATASVPSLSPRWPPSLTSLLLQLGISAWIFLTCSKHLSRKLRAGNGQGQGVASCAVRARCARGAAAGAGSRQGLRRSADLGSPGIPAAAHLLPSQDPDTHPSAS